MFTSLRATSDSLVTLLTRAIDDEPVLGPLFTAGGGTMEVTLNTPQEMNANSVQGLSVWLYRVVRDDQRLNAPLQRISATRLRPTPLPVRLHYLMTPVVAVASPDHNASPQREQEILGLVLQTLHDHATLRGADLQFTLAGTAAEVHLRLEPLTLEEITRVWNALGRGYQLSVSYEASVIEVDSARSDQVIAPVHGLQPEYGVIVETAP